MCCCCRSCCSCSAGACCCCCCRSCCSYLQSCAGSRLPSPDVVFGFLVSSVLLFEASGQDLRNDSQGTPLPARTALRCTAARWDSRARPRSCGLEGNKAVQLENSVTFRGGSCLQLRCFNNRLGQELVPWDSMELMPPQILRSGSGPLFVASDNTSHSPGEITTWYTLNFTSLKAVCEAHRFLKPRSKIGPLRCTSPTPATEPGTVESVP